MDGLRPRPARGPVESQLLERIDALRVLRAVRVDPAEEKGRLLEEIGGPGHRTDPALPDPALPDPALPDPALPDPALPDPAT